MADDAAAMRVAVGVVAVSRVRRLLGVLGMDILTSGSSDRPLLRFLRFSSCRQDPPHDPPLERNTEVTIENRLQLTE